jgi:hypothetical protein
MSRHDLEPNGSYPDHSIVVGWDPPLGTFFAQVKDTTKDEDDEAYMPVWEGYRLGEFTGEEGAEEVLGIVERYTSDHSAGLVGDLLADCENNR